MGLLSIIRKSKLKDRELRLLVLGLDNSGKTTIVKSLLKQNIHEVSPTVGFNINTMERDTFTLNIWDVGGQSSLRAFWFNYFEKTDSLIWVVDALALERLDENFAEFRKLLSEDKLTGCSVLIMINKVEELKDQERLQKLVESITENLHLDQIENHNCKVMPVSAFTGYNLEQGIDWLIKEYRERLYIL